MKRAHFIFFIIYSWMINIAFVTSSSAAAPDSVSTVAQIESGSSSVLPLENTFLWKIERQGYPTSYLFGTLHLGKEGSTLSTQLNQILVETSTLVTEANVKPEFGEAFNLGMLMVDSESDLSAVLGEPRFDQLSARIGSAIPKSHLKLMRPWAALIMIIYNKPNGYSEQFGLDMLLTQRAIELNKKRVFLEEAQEAIRVFSDLPQDKIISYINVLLDNTEEAIAETLELIDLYQNHQLAAIVDLYNDEEKMLRHFPESEKPFWKAWIEQELLNNRNEKWLVKLQTQLATEPTLVAVGALHLADETGLIHSLRKAGYTLSPIMPE